ncbi:MAG: hypothetical protein GY773_32195 [Actinomycetia bacterium]|nr:hypothetical protein [Actinomycetes bacterium]
MSRKTDESHRSGGKQSSEVVTVSTKTGSVVEARLRVLAAESLTIALGRQDRGQFIAGDEVTVAVGWGSLVGAKIASTTMLGHILICQLTVLRHLSGPPLVQAKERRATTRVTLPRKTSAVLMAVDETTYAVDIERTAAGRLVDVSLGGCGVELPRASAERFGSFSSVKIAFTLGPEGRRELLAELVNTHLNADDQLVLGYRWIPNQQAASALATIGRYTSSVN